MQVVHDEIADFNHIMVELIVVAQKFISLQLAPRHLEQFLEELSKTAKVLIVLLEKLVAHRSLPQLHYEVIDGLNTVLNLPSIVAWHLVWLHLLTI